MTARRASTSAPRPATVARQEFPVAHVTFVVIDHPKDPPTFQLIAGEAPTPAGRKALFTGFLEPGMGAALRRLAAQCDAIEERRAKGKGVRK